MQDVDAAAAKASSQFQVFAKPIGAVCNLDCAYCYYVKKKQLFQDSDSFNMPDDILETYILQHIQASPGRETHFTWHGGEPTLLGIDYFRKVVELQQKHKPHSFSVTNNMQTNGVLIDEAWCRFLSEEKFTVGLSLDGPERMHDTYRLTKSGSPTHKQAMHGYELLRRHGVPCDILCVVHAGNVTYPSRVYSFFREIGGRYIGFIPLVEIENGESVSGRTAPAEAWGDFLCTIYDEWLSRDIGRIKVQIFEEVARTALGHKHALCIFRDTCGDVPVVEHNGDFFSCDHFVDIEHNLGNITETPLVEMLESPAQRAFGNAKSELLPRYCLKCDVLDMCRGGCPKDRILRTPDGEAALNFLCAGYKRFFRHSRPFARELVSQSRMQSPDGRLTQRPAMIEKLNRKIGRNEPCPCGSGRKYKNCCLRK